MDVLLYYSPQIYANFYIEEEKGFANLLSKKGLQSRENYYLGVFRCASGIHIIWWLKLVKCFHFQFFFELSKKSVLNFH